MKIKIGRFQWSSRSEHRRLAVLMGVALIALVAGVSVIVGIVRMPGAVSRVQQPKPETLNLTRLSSEQSSQVLGDEALLLDPTPLFLPTPYNATQTDIASIVHRDPVESFKAYDPRYAFSDAAPSIAFHDAVPVPAAPVDALAYRQTQSPYATIGRIERPVSPLSPRMGFVEVVHAKTGKTILTLPFVPPSVQPKPAGANLAPLPAQTVLAIPAAILAGDWSPVEYLAAIDMTGLVGEPTLVQGSGAPAVLRFLEKYLVKDLRIGDRRELSAGFYILRVGP